MLLPWKFINAAVYHASPLWSGAASPSSSLHPSSSSHLDQARSILQTTPVLDGHWDLPMLIRWKFQNDVARVPYNDSLPNNVDLPRIHKGGVGGFWSAAFVICNTSQEGQDWLGTTNEVRDTLEQIDNAYQLAAYFPESVAVTRTPREHRQHVREGKVSHWISIEGAHSLGNSLATLRMYAELGVTSVALTHYCHNAFADSCSPPKARHGGLSELGHWLIAEMNRLGVAVDLSHSSTDTQLQAIEASEAPVYFSHSGAKGVYNHPRNIDDRVLDVLRTRKGQDTVVGIPFVSDFVHGTGGNSSLSDVADHADYIAQRIGGRHRVALGSDFDGSNEFAVGLEDASKYPQLVAELLRRGWTEQEVRGLASENYLRVIEAVQRKGEEIRSRKGVQDRGDTRPWKGRKDCECWHVLRHDKNGSADMLLVR